MVWSPALFILGRWWPLELELFIPNGRVSRADFIPYGMVDDPRRSFKK